MTELQKFIFDLKGWLVIPAVLDEAQTEACRQHLSTLAHNSEALPEHERNTYSGPCGELLDHPMLVPILGEIIAPDLTTQTTNITSTLPAEGETLAYGFRCDNSFPVIREASRSTPFSPHNGGPSMGPSHNFDFIHGKMVAPSVRVVWELNMVEKNGGGTPFLSGSHKSNYEIPAELREQMDELCWESYSCPAGSLVMFSENVCHGSAPWTNPDEPRMAIFSHYMHYCMRFHRMAPHPATIEAMPPLRRTLFRDVWMYDRPESTVRLNNYYHTDNRAHSREL